jgi:hypothetical protein
MIGTGALIMGGIVGGLVLQDRVEQSGRLPYYERDYVKFGWPRREVLENGAAWAGAGALTWGGMNLMDRGGVRGGVGQAMSAVGTGFMAGQVMGFVW